jgi:hypothetical protein
LWFVFLLLLLFIFVLGKVHFGIYKSSYNISNISYLNSPPPSFSFIPSSSHSRISFNRYYFCIYIHVYTVFALYSPSYTLLIPPPLPSYWYQLGPLPYPPGPVPFSFKSSSKEKHEITFSKVFLKY